MAVCTLKLFFEVLDTGTGGVVLIFLLEQVSTRSWQLHYGAAVEINMAVLSTFALCERPQGQGSFVCMHQVEVVYKVWIQ